MSAGHVEDTDEAVVVRPTAPDGAVDAFGRIRRACEWRVGARLRIALDPDDTDDGGDGRWRELLDVARAMPRHVDVCSIDALTTGRHDVRWRGRLHLPRNGGAAQIALVGATPVDGGAWTLVSRGRVTRLDTIAPLLDAPVPIVVEDGARNVDDAIGRDGPLMAQFVPLVLDAHATWESAALRLPLPPSPPPTPTPAAPGPHVVIHRHARLGLIAQRLLGAADVAWIDPVATWLRGASAGHDATVLDALLRVPSRGVRTDGASAAIEPVPCTPERDDGAVRRRYGTTWLLSRHIDAADAVGRSWRARQRRYQTARELRLAVPLLDHGVWYSESANDDDGSASLAAVGNEFGTLLGDSQRLFLSLPRQRTERDRTRVQNKLRLEQAIQARLDKMQRSLPDEAFRLFYRRCKEQLRLNEQDRVLRASELNEAIDANAWALALT